MSMGALLLPRVRDGSAERICIRLRQRHGSLAGDVAWAGEWGLFVGWRQEEGKVKVCEC